MSRGTKMKDALMGIDVGTSGCKTAVFSSDGQQLAVSFEPYDLICPFPGAMELDPEIVMKAVLKTMEGCASACDMKRVAALAVSTQGEAAVLTDANGIPLFNALLTFDSRNEKEFEWFKGEFSAEHIAELTGMPVHPMFTVTKLLYLREHEKEKFNAVKRIMCFGDFVVFRLGAEPCVDYSMAARTMMFDLKNRCWSKEILDRCGLEEEKLSRPVPAGTVIGTVNPAIAEHLGMDLSVKIVAGSHDQICCAVGSGITESGIAMDSLGTTESTACIDGQLLIRDIVEKRNIPVYEYPISGNYAYMSFLTCSASLLKWFKEKVLHYSGDDYYTEYENYARAHLKNPTGLYLLPYFAGAGTPDMDFKARGLLYGLTLDTDSYRIYKAIMESVSFEQKINLENMTAGGIKISEMRCIGGGARSDLFLQTKADITGLRVLRMETKETGCLGAAMLAGIGSGITGSVSDTVRRFVRTGREFLPDPEMSEKYREGFEKYRKIYSAVRTIWS